MYDKIKGNWATLLLPVREDDSIDYALLEEEIRHFCMIPVDGIYSNGTAGEFFSQSEDEFRTISDILASICTYYNVPFQIGCSHMAPNISLERIEYAARLKPLAIQVILPDWFPSNDNAAIRFLHRCAEKASPIPLVLYNPPHAKRRLQPSDFIKIIENVPEVRGIKTADGDAAWYSAMKPVFEMVSVFVPGHHLATGISRGAAGAYSNVACLSPAKAQSWYDMMLSNLPAALELEKELQHFFELYIDPLIIKDGYPNFAIDKFMASIGGYVHGLTARVRFPYDSVPFDVSFYRQKLKETAPYFVDDSISEDNRE